MKRRSVLALLLAASCAGGSPRATKPAPAKAPSPTARIEAGARLSAEVVGWIAASDLDATLVALATRLRPEGAPADGAEARKALFALLDAPDGLAAVIDPGRPAAVAILDPRKHPERAMAALLVALPVTSRADATRAMPGAHLEFSETRGGTYAVVSYDRAIRGEDVAMEEILAQAPERGVRVHGSIDRLGDCCAADLQGLVASVLQVTAPSGNGAIYGAYGMRFVVRALELGTSASSFDLILAPTDDAMRLTLRAEGAAASPFGTFAASQQAGAPWGVELLPADTFVMYATRLTPGEHDLETESLAAYLSVTDDRGDGQREAGQFHAALGDVFGVVAGEVVYGVWAAKGGGMGNGGAFRVSDGAKARDAMARLYEQAGEALASSTALQLAIDPKKVELTTRYRRGATRIGKVAVDVVTVRAKFAPEAAHERKMMKWLFGDELTLGIAVDGDRVLWASGRDWRVRLEGMLRAAHGEDVPSLARDARYAAAADGASGISLSYVATAPLARFVIEAMKVVGTGDTAHEAAMAPFAASEDGVILSATRVGAEDGRAVYELVTTVPQVVAADLPMVGGAMWRVGLSPLLGPPALPPLPAPPPTVTPPAAPPAPKAPGQLPGNAPELPTGRGA